MIRDFRLKRQVKKLLSELDLRHDFDAPLVCQELKKLGYNIVLYPLQMPEGLESTYILYENIRVIYYKKNASHFRQQHLIFHELGHMFLGHRKLHTEELLWGGTIYPRWEEREAEIFASLLMEAAFSKKRRRGELSRRFQQTLFNAPKSREKIESLRKIATFFKRIDGRTKDNILQKG